MLAANLSSTILLLKFSIFSTCLQTKQELISALYLKNFILVIIEHTLLNCSSRLNKDTEFHTECVDL
jgi:hypothetical protein